MAYDTNQKIKEYQKKRHRRSTWKKVLGFLGCVVVFCTTYALILPAITQEHTTYCGVEEHTHSAENGCYEKQLVCGYDDAGETESGHVHTDECYEYSLICEQTEHTHTTACFSNPEADVETAKDWEKTFADVELTGEYWNDILEIAKTQIGYQESEKNYQVVTNDAGEEVLKGYTRYGAWYGMPYEDWCAMFVSFCLNYAQVPTEVFPQSAGCESWIEALEEQGLYYTAAEYQSEEMGGPYEGDLVFFDWADGDGNYDGLADHVGIVSERVFADDGYTMTGFKTIEGNSGDKVTDKNEYFFLDENGEENKEILGFGLIPREDIVLKAEGVDYTITVRYTEEANLPKDTRLEVREILSGTEEYESYASQAAQVMNEEEGETTRRFFDITLMSGDSEVEPAVPVSVTISLAEAQPTGEDTVVHFPNEGEVELIPATADADGVHYEQPSFSVVGAATANSSSGLPAQDYAARYDRNVEINAIANVGGTITVSLVNSNGAIQTSRTGTVAYTGSANTYVSASYASGVLTITGLQDTTALTDKVVTLTLTHGGTNDRHTTTVNVLVTDDADYSDLYTNNRYNHLEVKVDAKFNILIYDEKGEVTSIIPTDVAVQSVQATVYHTRDSADDTLTDSLADSPDYEKITNLDSNGNATANSQIAKGSTASGTATTIGGMWSLVGQYGNTVVTNYKTDAEFNGQTGLISYDVVFGSESTDATTGDKVRSSIGKGYVNENTWSGGRRPLAIYDGDTIEITAEISYVYNGRTYTAEYTVDYVVSSYFNLCPYDLEAGVEGAQNPDAYRGFDVKIDVQDIVEMAPTYVQKVDQYGDPVSGATLAVYATNASYEYALDDGGYSTWQDTWTVADNGDVYSGDTKVITAKDTGTTDQYGQYTWEYDPEKYPTLAGVTMTMTGIQEMIGSPYFIMREIGVPAGYRTVSDEIKLQFKQAGSEALSTVMVCNNPYESGVWAGANAHVEAPQILYTADANASPQNNGRQINYWSNTGTEIETTGTLFAVVLKRNGQNLSSIDTWYPVYGSDAEGYTVSESNGISAVITAAQNAQSYGSTAFRRGDSGLNVIANLYNLPSDIIRYYTYLLDSSSSYSDFLSTYGNSSDSVNSEPQYVVAYYWTSAGSVDEATESNTYRVISHSGIDTSLTEFQEFTIQWGTTIEVPNMENRLFFQKRDEAQSTSADAGLIDNAVFALYPAIDAAQVSDSATTESRLEYYVGDDGGEGENKKTVYVIPYTPGTTGYDPQNPYKAAVFGTTDDNPKVHLLGTGTYAFDADIETLTFDSTTGLVYYTDSAKEAGLMTVTFEDGTKYYVHPTKNAEGKPMVGYTHDSCYASSESGTGHFDKLTEDTYLLREIAAPDGYALNDTNIPVLVNSIGVYANAGTDTDGVSVGNGVGYLTKTLDVFASPGQIDETLTWIYGALIRSNATGFIAFDNVTHDVVHVQQDGGEATGWEFAEHLENDLAAYGTGSGRDRSKAMVIYYEYNGSLANDETKSSPIFDYIPNDDPNGGQTARTEGTQDGQTLANGTLLNRLWTKTGWSDMAIYQDSVYGNNNTISNTKYTDLTSYGNISNLFSSSTFVTVADKPIINEAQVDVNVNKVALSTVTGEDGTETTTSSPLAGAQFRLYKMDGTTTSYYAYNTETGTTSWVGESGTYTILTSDATGALNDVFHNLLSGTYYLEEVTTPDGHAELTGPITITVNITQDTSDTAVVQVTITYGTDIYSYSYDSSAAQVETKPTDNASGFDVTSRVTTEAQTGGTAGFKGTYLYTITVPNQVKPVVNVSVNKVKEDGQTALQGAEFQLYRLDGENKVYYSYSAANGTIWGEQSAATTLTSSADGTLDGIFHELDDTNASGAISYYLVETKAPNGYNLLTQPIKIDVEVAGSSAAVKISVGDTVLYDSAGGGNPGNTGYSVSAEKSDSTYLYTLTVPNSTGYELPHTGGPGTLALTLMGLALTALAGCGLVWKRKRGGAA